MNTSYPIPDYSQVQYLWWYLELCLIYPGISHWILSCLCPYLLKPHPYPSPSLPVCEEDVRNHCEGDGSGRAEGRSQCWQSRCSHWNTATTAATTITFTATDIVTAATTTARIKATNTVTFTATVTTTAGVWQGAEVQLLFVRGEGAACRGMLWRHRQVQLLLLHLQGD